MSEGYPNPVISQYLTKGLYTEIITQQLSGRMKNQAKEKQDAAFDRRLRKAIKQHLNSTRELKQYANTSLANNANPGFVTLLSNITGGTNVSNRDGWQVNAMELRMRLSLQLNGAASVDLIRVLIVSDSMNLNSAPSVLDVLDSASVYSARNYGADIANRFKFYHDKLYSLSSQGSSKENAVNLTFKLGGRPISYWNTTGTGKNNLYVVVLGDSAANPALVSFGWAVRYYDS